ncbi:MAG TPA: hypothetical protein VGF56_12905 [Rhizomicrobium sp.]|jgi:hypothetical protein
MTGVIRKFAAFGALALLAACGTSRDGGDDLQKQLAQNNAYFAGEYACAKADAVTVQLGEIEKHPEKYADRCLRIDAFSDGSKLYSGGLEMQHDQRSAAVIPRVGVVWKNPDMERHLRVGPSFVTVVGRMRDCAQRLAMQQKGEDIRARIAGTAPASVTGHGDCRHAHTVFVSDAQVVPTAMD